MTWTTNPEVLALDGRRGHAFAPPAELAAAIPALYSTEATPAEGKNIWLHYFVAACDWYVAELDPDSGLAFGYANLGDPANAEWGYVDLGELGAVEARARVSGAGLALSLPLVVERDLYWQPCPFGQIASPGRPEPVPAAARNKRVLNCRRCGAATGIPGAAYCDACRPERLGDSLMGPADWAREAELGR